jgi:hypothetical protein
VGRDTAEVGWAGIPRQTMNERKAVGRDTLIAIKVSRPTGITGRYPGPRSLLDRWLPSAQEVGC